MNNSFYWCVGLLKAIAEKLNMTYEEVNIWIFVIIEPVIFFIMIWVIYKQYLKIKSLKIKVRAL